MWRSKSPCSEIKELRCCEEKKHDTVDRVSISHLSHLIFKKEVVGRWCRVTHSGSLMKEAFGVDSALNLWIFYWNRNENQFLVLWHLSGKMKTSCGSENHNMTVNVFLFFAELTCFSSFFLSFYPFCFSNMLKRIKADRIIILKCPVWFTQSHIRSR